MAKVKSKKQKAPLVQRERRYFEESLKKAIVREIDQSKLTVIEACRIYQVSRGAIYKWLNKYSPSYQKAVVKVVELKSESRKRGELEKRVKELERVIGSQQVELLYLKKLIEVAEKRFDIQIKKNVISKH